MKFYPVSFFTGIIDTHRFPSAMHMHTYRSNWIRMGLQSDIIQYMDWSSMKLQLPIYIRIYLLAELHISNWYFMRHITYNVISLYILSKMLIAFEIYYLSFWFQVFLFVIFVCSLTYYFEYNLINSTE